MDNQKKHPQSDKPHPTKGTSLLMTCFNGVNTLNGIGILSVPYALSKGGWLSLGLLILVALSCFYTGLLLHRCMNCHSHIKSYPDIGQVAFGRKGRVVISTFLYLELFLLAVEFLIMEADNLHKLFPYENFQLFGRKIEGKKGFALLTGLVVLPTTWLRSLGILAYVSAGGVISSVVVLLAVVWAAAFDQIGFHEHGELCNWSGLPTTISLFTFCYLGHSVFLTICTSMKNKSHFPKVLLVCFVLSTISYGSMSILGYLMFGEQLTSQVTLNLPTKFVSSKIAIYATLIMPITKYAIIIAPIAAMVEETFPFRESIMMSCFIRTCLVISTLFVAIMVPFFGHVMAFMGAFVGIILSIVFPCLCYWKIVIGFKKFGSEKMMILIIMLIGTFVAVVGTYTSLTNIINEFRAK